MQIQVNRGVVVTAGGTEFLVNIGVVIEADSIKEAIAKTEPTEGVTVSLGANPGQAGIDVAIIKEAIGKAASAEGMVVQIVASPRPRQTGQAVTAPSAPISK